MHNQLPCSFSQSHKWQFWNRRGFNDHDPCLYCHTEDCWWTKWKGMCQAKLPKKSVKWELHVLTTSKENFKTPHFSVDKCKRLEHLVTRCSNMLWQYVMLQGQITFFWKSCLCNRILPPQEVAHNQTSGHKEICCCKMSCCLMPDLYTRSVFFGMTCHLVCSNFNKFSPTILLTIQFRLFGK